MKPASFQDSSQSQLIQQAAKLLSETNYNSAINVCNIILQSNHDCFEAFYYKGVALSWMKNYQEAVQSLHTAASLSPNNEAVYSLLAQCLQRSSDFQAAINNYDLAIGCNRTKIELYINKADCHKALKDYEGEVKCYNAAIKVSSTAANLYNFRGNAYRKLRKYEEAIADYNKAIELGPTYINAYMNKASTCDECRMYEEAVKAYDGALRLNPNGENIYFAKGNSLQNLGNDRDAVDCYDAAIEINPNDANYHFRKGISLNELGSYEFAINCYNVAIRLKNDFSSAYVNRGISMNNAGRYQDAVESYIKAIEISPDDAEIYNHKGVALMNMRALDEALESYNTAIRLNPDYALCFCNRGRVYNELRNERAALEDFTRASELIKNDGLRRSLSRSDVDFIKNTLRNDQAKLLEKLRKFQRKAIKFEEEISIDNHLIEANQVFKIFVAKQVEKIKEQQAELVEKLADKITPRNANSQVNQSTQELMNELKNMQKQMDDLKKHYNEEIAKINQVKVDKEDIEVSALKINPVIRQNRYLNLYYSALYDKLHTLIAESEVICGGNLALDTSGPGTSLIGYILGMSPIFGDLLSEAFGTAVDIINSNSIRNQAIKIRTITGRNPDEREGAIKRTAENITLNIKRKLVNIATNVEVEYWCKQGLLERCRNFFKVNVDNRLYESPEEILGCIDALKIIMAIMNNQFDAGLNTDEFVLRASSIPSMYRFTKGKNIEALDKSKAQSNSKKKKKKNCEVFAVSGIEYKNQLLNKPEMLRELSKITGLSLTKIIDYSWKLEELGYEPLELDLDLLGSILLSLD